MIPLAYIPWSWSCGILKNKLNFPISP